MSKSVLSNTIAVLLFALLAAAIVVTIGYAIIDRAEPQIMAPPSTSSHSESGYVPSLMM